MSDFEKIVREIIFDSPPEEIPLVYDNLLVLTEGQSKQKIKSIIQELNEKKRASAINQNDRFVISELNKAGSKYFDPLKKVLFSVDPITLEASDLEEYTDVNPTDIQLSIANELDLYTEKFFPQKTANAVFQLKDSSKFAIIIVAKKKSLSDFWSGFWVSEYVYDAEAKELTGSISLDAHYFEDGNVRFKSESKLETTKTQSPIISLKEFECNFEKALIKKFQYMNETQFKSLRRRLPVTRSKINWTQGVGNYRLGRDAAQGI